MKMTIADRNRRYFDNDSRKENLREKSVRAGIYTMSFQAIESLFRIGAIAVLARLLIPEYFGLISMVTAVTAIAEQFKDFGLSTATIQQKDITHNQVSNLFWINVGIGFFLMMIVSAGSFLLAWFFNEQRLIYITIALSTGFFVSGLTVQHQAILQRHLRLSTIGSIQVASTGASTLIAIIMAFKGYGIWTLVWREVLRGVFICLGTWIRCPWIPSPPRKQIKIDHLLRFGRDIAGFNIIVFFAASLDQIFIGKFYGAAQLGIYRQALYLMFYPLTQLMQPLSRVMEPALSILQDDAERYCRYYTKVLMTLAFVIMPITLYCFVFSHEVISVVLGNKWIEAVDIFRMLALAAFIRPVSDTTLSLLITCGKTRRYFNLGLVTALILLASFGIGLIWGARGVSCGYLAATYILLILRLIYNFEGTPVKRTTFFDTIKIPLMASILMMLILFIVQKLVTINNSLMSIGVTLPTAVVAYLLSWIMIAGGRERLRIIVEDLVKSFHMDRYFVFMTSVGKK